LAIASAVGLSFVVVHATPATAADRNVPSIPAALPDWAGPYVGGHLGYGRGRVASTLTDVGAVSSTNSFGSLFAGVHGGYNVTFASRFVAGLEADVSFANFSWDDQIAARARSDSIISEEIDYIARVRGRFGYAFDRLLVYGTGGFAWSQARLFERPGAVGDEDKRLRTRTGWVAGAGAELVLTPEWSGRLEYLYDHLGGISETFPLGARYESAFNLHTVRLGLSRKLGSYGDGKSGTDTGDFSALDWNVHGQTTIIGQGYPSFRSPYEGTNSLTGNRQIKNTSSATAFVGVRLPQGTEFYVNPELMQGGGLSDTFGLGGYSNGEAQKSGFPVPRANIARAFVKHTFGLGGEQETVADGANQLAGKQDISRITVAAGKFSVIDYFDGNVYSHDPRRDFLNWNMYCCGSYDLTMDKVGYTWGAYAELNQKYWAFRTGYFLLPTVSNVNTFDMHIPERGQYLAELELRYSLWSQPGKLRLMGYLSRGNAGSYAEAVALPVTSPDYPDIALTRRARNNPGFVVNLEQAITDDLGVFSRASLGSGRTEKMGWTDCDVSFSLGTVLKGTTWGRPDDRIGVGGAVNGLSPQARSYFAAGGLGILIGDGQLNYRTERAVEAFYAYAVNAALTVTADYQFIQNPAYNADRGPVSIFSGRMHAEF
jgi:high affinity Mn2+ porin